MLKIKNIFLTALGLASFSLSLFSGLKNKEVKEVKADPLQEVGKISMTEMEIYHPYSNQNEFILLKLEGTDYPTSGSEEMFNEGDVNFDFDLDNTLYLYNLDGDRVMPSEYFQVYSLPHGMNDNRLTFSIWLSGIEGVKKATFKDSFKIPSYAYLKGDTSSPTYGYYSLDKEYKAIAENIDYVASQGSRFKWIVREDNYDRKEVDVCKIYSFVDGSHEMLSFKLFGQDLDYGDAPSNAHLDVSKISEQLPNFKNKVHLYDENKNELNYNLEFISTINLWEEKSCYSVGIDVLANAKSLLIEEGLILPSNAYRNGNTSSELYNGFVVQNELYLAIDELASHTTGAKISWNETVDIIGELTINKVYTNKPFTTDNEFFCITFNEETDFATKGALKWGADKYGLLRNISTHYHLYDSTYNELSNTHIHDIYFNYSADNTGRNSIAIMTDLSGLAVRANIKDGFLIPSYAYYSGDKTSENYGYYSLKIEYNLTIESGHTIHNQYESIKWNVPSCSIEYYDENNSLISSYSDSASLGETYYLRNVPAKEGYVGSWVITSPNDLEIVDNRIIIPLVSQTIRIKANYTEVVYCSIRYLNENGDEFTSLAESALTDSVYELQPLISKKGHDARWVVVSPEGIEIANNRITIPSTSTVITLQIHYTPRHYVIFFDNNVTKEVVYNSPLGELPLLPNIDGKVGKWLIDDEYINAETLYLWDENKTATSTYIDRMCVISFNVMGGDELENSIFEYGQVVDDLPTPTKEGYFFNFWAIDEGGIIPFVLGEEIKDDFVLYASWLRKCVVTFDSNGGSSLEDIAIGEGQKLERQPIPTRDGYTFVCWTLNGAEFNFNTKITSDITLVAKWDKIDSGDSDSDDKKCGGNLAFTSVILSLLSLSGITLLFIKKKD